MIHYGMVGGGPGAFIGDVHRKAIRMDGMAELKAGCFSRDFHTSKKLGEELGLAENRIYKDYREMAEKESEREDGIEFVSVVTPNSTHYEICRTFLEHHINIFCEKPLTFTLEEAEELEKLAEKNNLLFGMAYTFTGYPAVKQIREMIQSGMLGKIRFVNAEYPSDWLARPVEKEENPPWRLNPEYSGNTNCLGDIGVHIQNLISYTTKLRIKRVSAHIDAMVKGRKLDDNAVINVEYEGGAKGLFWSSQIAWGYDDAAKVRIFGEKGSLQWFQEDPDHLIYTPENGPTRHISRGRDSFLPPAQRFCRLPSGHPEGIYEAFANLYRSYISALEKRKQHIPLSSFEKEFPSCSMGVESMRYIDRCLKSSREDSSWVDFTG